MDHRRRNGDGRDRGDGWREDHGAVGFPELLCQTVRVSEGEVAVAKYRCRLHHESRIYQLTHLSWRVEPRAGLRGGQRQTRHRTNRRAAGARYTSPSRWILPLITLREIPGPISGMILKTTCRLRTRGAMETRASQPPNQPLRRGSFPKAGPPAAHMNALLSRPK